MRLPPVRVRLTAWYLAIILITFMLFSFGMYFGIRRALEDTVDRQLTLRLINVRHALAQPDLRIRDREIAGLFKPGDDLCQISDTSGQWIYQSPAMRDLEIPTNPLTSRRHHRDTGQLTTISRKHSDIRVLTIAADTNNVQYAVQVATVVSPLYDVLLTFRFASLIAVPFLVIIAGLGGYWLSGRALRPVRALVVSARGISEHSLTERLQVPPAKDELSELAETLNEMLARLDSAFKRIAQFTADASHELRTPITVIRTTAEIILQKTRSPAQYEAMVGQILSEAEFTSELIESLLTLARADSSSTSLNIGPVDASEVLAEVDLRGRALAEAGKVNWSSAAEPGKLIILAEKQHIVRLLLILIENAIRYTRLGGTVQLTLREADGSAAFEVTDSGIGIPLEVQARIFDRFYRASNARTMNPNGSGLGLAIAHWIAEAHRGSLEVSSVIDAGTTMRLRLPLTSGQGAQT